MSSPSPPGAVSAAERRWEAVLLAAGASTRMKAPKALLAWDGKPLIAHQLDELLATRIERIVVVLGAHEMRIRETAALDRYQSVKNGVGERRVEFAINRDWSSGKSASIRLGASLMSKRATDVAVVAVDQPTTAEVLEALLAEHERSGGEGTVPTYEGRGGHPLLLRRSRLQHLRRVSEKTQGMRALVSQMEVEGVLRRIEIAAPCVLWNLNRPEDVRRIGRFAPQSARPQPGKMRGGAR